MRFNKLYKMSDTHSRMLFSLFSYKFITTNLSCNIFEVLSFELVFISRHGNKFFSTKVDIMIVCNQVAK